MIGGSSYYSYSLADGVMEAAGSEIAEAEPE
jgi:hypothetical protein